MSESEIQPDKYHLHPWDAEHHDLRELVNRARLLTYEIHRLEARIAQVRALVEKLKPLPPADGISQTLG